MTMGSKLKIHCKTLRFFNKSPRYYHDLRFCKELWITFWYWVFLTLAPAFPQKNGSKFSKFSKSVPLWENNWDGKA